jgi:TfoX/Sxy family transcriptional regulator of competence genes
MAYSKSLADRIRWALRSNHNIEEKKMFGGVGFLLNGNMLVGVWESSLIVRLGPEQAAEALKRSTVKEFDVTGRPMKGWVMVEPDGLDSDTELANWVEQAKQFVEKLPAK